MQNLKIEHLIRNRTLITIAPHQRVRWACKVMTKHRISALPVVKGGIVIGIVTERDIVQKCVAANRPFHVTTTADIMTPDPLTVRYDETIAVAIRRMSEHNIRHLPVQCRDMTICGMVSMRQLMSVMRDRLTQNLLYDMLDPERKFTKDTLHRILN